MTEQKPTPTVYRTINLDQAYYERLCKLAAETRRTIVEQLRVMIDAADTRKETK
jgi:macrodomain Ter protein organizer (MatP/YcbG family)